MLCFLWELPITFVMGVKKSDTPLLKNDRCDKSFEEAEFSIFTSGRERKAASM